MARLCQVYNPVEKIQVVDGGGFSGISVCKVYRLTFSSPLRLAIAPPLRALYVAGSENNACYHKGNSKSIGIFYTEPQNSQG